MGRHNKNKNKNKARNDALPIRKSLNAEAATFVPKDEESTVRPETRESINFTNSIRRLELTILTQQAKPSTLLFRHNPLPPRCLFVGQSPACHHLDRSQQHMGHQDYPHRQVRYQQHSSHQVLRHGQSSDWSSGLESGHPIIFRSERGSTSTNLDN